MPIHDYNPQYYDKSSVYRTFIHIRSNEPNSRVDKWEITVLKFSPEFRIRAENSFPNSSFPPYSIHMKVTSGQTESSPGPTGITILYTQERSRSGFGNSIDSCWNNYQNSGFYQGAVQKKEIWETTVDGLWLSEESESTPMGTITWRHKPGSLDFLFPYSEFRSPSSLHASLYYDYRLNRIYKLGVEKNPNKENLVFKEGNNSIYFQEGQFVLIQNP